VAKKKRFKKPEFGEEELENLRLHSIMIEEKTKAINEKYRKWWDKENKTWKKGFKGHGNS
jgi:hypothetical protein